MNITLQSITEENFLDAFNLKLKKEQESFVSHPVRSLAQAYVYRDQCQPFGIYHEDKGYGKAAMQKVLEYIKTKPFGTSNRIALTCNTENAPALHLYTSLGFAPTGAKYDDEIELVLNL